MQINKYSVDIFKSPTEENKFKVETFEVGLENDLFVVLKDLHFTKLKKSGDDRYSLDYVIGKHHIYETNYTHATFLNGIHYCLYTYNKVRPSTIRRQIEIYIKEKWGFLFNVNLDFIKAENV